MVTKSVPEITNHKFLIEEIICCCTFFLVLFPLSQANDARYKLFTKSKTHSPQSLPLTKDALYLHIERSNYQCRHWKNVLDCHHVLEEPTKWKNRNGMKTENGSLEIRWTNEKPASESILEFVTCNYRKSQCIKNQCSCKAVRLPCTDLCKCKGCENDDQRRAKTEKKLMISTTVNLTMNTANVMKNIPMMKAQMITNHSQDTLFLPTLIDIQ